jgi:integrase
MPRKPKVEKQTITVVVNGSPIGVTLHPPTGSRKSWYAYWPSLVTSKSTGQRNLEDAIVAAENMVRNGGERGQLEDSVLSDEEFLEIQRVHYRRKQDDASRVRAEKSLFSCVNAITAFQEITGLKLITLASPDDCAAFQRKALTLPKNWRQQYPKSKAGAKTVSPNTVLKWSRALHAAFERANKNAGRKCVRGVLPESKLLTQNPWSQFIWIEGRERPLRQFDAEELLALLDYFQSEWPGITIATCLVKLALWSSARKEEITGLRWPSLRAVGSEYHFAIVGKWGVERWCRVPEGLYHELLALKTDSPFVFAAYNDQLRHFHEEKGRPDNARRVAAEYKPVCLADWFSDRLEDWSAALPKGHAYPHVFRKTGLQYARSGEDINRQVAADARVSESVMMTNYVKETDEQLRQASNRTFARLVASLPAEVARRYGHAEIGDEDLEQLLRAAIAAKDWLRVTGLSARLAGQRRSPTG